VLVVLSTVKFMFVIFYFMHLRWDRAFCTIVFFIGLVLAAGTMWALLKLFGADASRPLPVTLAHPPAIAPGIA
jgi:cytochrome c oxidase subunit 4